MRGRVDQKSGKPRCLDRRLSHSGIFFLTAELFEAYRDVLCPLRARSAPLTAHLSISLCRSAIFSPPSIPSFSRSHRSAGSGKGGPFIFTVGRSICQSNGRRPSSKNAGAQREKTSQVNGGASRKTSQNSVGGGVAQ